MAVKSSGSLSLTTDIIGEFGGDVPHSLSEYYGGGTYVPAGANPGVATSGTINMGSFYDTVAATVLTITSNTNNYDIGAEAISAGGDKNTPVILTINSGVTVGSTSSSNPAMKTGTGWGSGVTINITNNGSIVGASGSNTSGYAQGGSGGAGAKALNCGRTNGYPGSSGSSGSGGSADSVNNGGNAFEHSQTGDNNLSVIFDTIGTRSGGSAGTKTIYGGGGGGGGGGSYKTNYKFIGGGGGGGGAGSPGGSGGAGGCGQHGSGSSGSTGSSSSGGSGGAGGYWCCTTVKGGNGGNGGSLGSSGSSGAYAAEYERVPGAGGAGGSNGSVNGSAGSALSGNTGQIS